LLYKGTDNTLGIIAGAIATVAVVGTLFLMYGEFPIFNIISVVVSISMAYRIAAR
jgi:preprotein translocase subunit SecD